MRTILSATLVAGCLAVSASPASLASTYTLKILTKADAVGTFTPTLLADSGAVLGTVGIQGSGSLALQKPGSSVSTYDHCGLQGAADGTTVTAASPYSAIAFIVGGCAGGTSYSYDAVHNVTNFVSYPSAINTDATGVNGGGFLTGDYLDTNDIYHGFYRLGSTYVHFDPPGSFATFPEGMNSQNTIFGVFRTVGNNEGDNSSGFLLDEFGNYTIINVPSAFYTEVTALNGSNHAAGGYFPNVTGASEQAYAWNNGTFTLFPLNERESIATSINESGNIAGFYVDSANKEHGFVWQPSTGQVLTVEAPSNAKFMSVRSVNNNHAEVAGYYFAGKKYFAFTATCSGAGCF